MARRIVVALSVVGVLSSSMSAASKSRQLSMEASLDFSSTSSVSSSDVDIRNVGDGAAAAEFGSIVSVKSTNPEYCAKYLCSSSSLGSTATAYLKEGCHSSFSTYAASAAETDLAARSASSQAAEGLTNIGLFAMSGSFGLVALVLGFVMGRREADHRSNLSSIDPSLQSLLH